MGKNYCSGCGTKLEKNDDFCSNCGKKIKNISKENTNNTQQKNTHVVRYVFGGVFVFLGLVSFLDITSLRDEIPGLFLLLFGISMMPFVYEKYLYKIKIKKISVFLPILFMLCFIFSVPTDIKDDEKLEIDKITFSEFNWPNSSVGKMLPIPKSNIGYIEWENESGFVIYVSETTIDDYNDYVKACEEKGFTVEINKGENYYKAKNKNSYSLKVDYEENKVMFIRIDVPKTSNKTDSKDNQKKQDYNNLGVIKNSTLKNNFIKACKDIKMDIAQISNLAKKDDWSNGPRYTFNYKNNSFILYAYDNGGVSSITIANINLDKIYLEGFEPYNVNDYLMNDEVIADLQVAAENSIEKTLKYPSTSDFNWISSGAYSRYKNIYVVTGTFNAKNSFGVKIESSFYVEEKITNDKISVVYLVVDNKKYIGSSSQINNSNRKEIKQTSTSTNNNDIIIKDGQKGTYGKEDLFDGEKYIRYYVPAGKYKVEALVKNADFYIESKKIYKEDGWDTSTVIREVKLPKMGDTVTIEIKADQCISLVIHSQIKLTKTK